MAFARHISVSILMFALDGKPSSANRRRRGPGLLGRLRSLITWSTSSSCSAISKRITTHHQLLQIVTLSLGSAPGFIDGFLAFGLAGHRQNAVFGGHLETSATELEIPRVEIAVVLVVRQLVEL